MLRVVFGGDSVSMQQGIDVGNSTAYLGKQGEGG
jgi:hypothetical protein